jgi:hypothetical protein
MRWQGKGPLPLSSGRYFFEQSLHLFAESEKSVWNGRF